MSVIEALILGIVQGLTEFLPISSTAHVVVASKIMNVQFPGLALEIFLHLASVLAVILYFHKDLLHIISGFINYARFRDNRYWVEFRFGLYIIAATFISGTLGVILSDLLSESLKTPPVIAAALIITGLFLIFIEKVQQIGAKDEADMTFTDTVVIALAQTLAVLPGISRSGSTLVAALWTGLGRETAVRFSFLLAIPIILGSTVLMIQDLDTQMVMQIGGSSLFVAFTSSFLFSLIGIVLLIDLLKKSRLYYFAVYCFIFALFILLFLDHSFMMNANP